mmetsp:Transcript_10086/g.25287  ORF Transcript_10086/g.25287 Transcript_10086/m.25287 type:complete len:460 (-) Transcript_10086:162-1541(-)
MCFTWSAMPASQRAVNYLTSVTLQASVLGGFSDPRVYYVFGGVGAQTNRVNVLSPDGESINENQNVFTGSTLTCGFSAPMDNFFYTVEANNSDFVAFSSLVARINNNLMQAADLNATAVGETLTLNLRDATEFYFALGTTVATNIDLDVTLQFARGACTAGESLESCVTIQLSNNCVTFNGTSAAIVRSNVLTPTRIQLSISAPNAPDPWIYTHVRLADSGAALSAVRITVIDGPEETVMPTPSPTPAPTLTPGETAGPTMTPAPTGAVEIGGDPCFPGSAEVELRDGSVRRMDELEVGDSVRVGPEEFSDVLFFSHRLFSGVFDFVRLEVSGAEQPLVLTKNHYLPVASRSNQLVAAGAVRVGDSVVLASGKTAAVISVAEARAEGLFNPHTVDGTLVVNGVTTSCFTTSVVPWLAHVLLRPVYWMFRAKIGGELLGRFFEDGQPAFAAIMPKGASVY